MTVIEINEQNQYTGLQLKVMAILGNIQQNLQIDIGYGDVVTPNPIAIDFPVILEDFAVPHILAYTIETIIAEKLHAMMVLAQLNSRMKDFYDVHVLIKNQQIDKDILKLAITQTFQNRSTPVNFESVIFTKEFMESPQRQSMWNAYLKKINAVSIPFEEVMKSIEELVNFV